MRVSVRYITKRVNSSGAERWYWQRPGFRLTRLPDTPTERIAIAERLNFAADRGQGADPTYGTIRWVAAKYRASEEYLALKHGTTKYYERFLRDIEALGPDLPFASFTRADVVNFVESYPKPHQRRQVAVVLGRLFDIARYYGIVAQNEATRLRVKTNPPRDRLWTENEITRWIAAARQEDPHMLTAFLLLQYTAQRPSDVLAMARAHYKGGAISVLQKKTGKLLDVPCHPALAAHLDQLPLTGMMLVTYRGRRVNYQQFRERFHRIATQAGIDAQARDLRRTAMVNMALAGATTPQIASVSGHSIDNTQRMLEVYLPRNRELAQAAITKLAEYRKP